ncbi:hypothetical protein CC85DRAFT_239843, partial [Cutaneotrichosporon oleaginosum]
MPPLHISPHFFTSLGSPAYELQSAENVASGNTYRPGRRLTWVGIVELCMIPVLVCLSGLFTGLIIATESHNCYFSVNQTKLQTLSLCGKPREQLYARRILILRQNPYQLLTTLVLFSVIANESVPVVTGGVIPSRLHSVIVSTAANLVFAALLPMCISTRHALPIAGSMAWIVQRLVWLTFPVSWPASKLLGFVLGQQKPPVFHRFELRELIRLHHTQPESQLGDDTFQLTWNALTLSTLTAKAAMVPLEKVFMLPWDKDLDYRALCNIHEASWSRIVVYNQHEDVQIIYGYILSRSLILHNPHKRISLQKVPVYELPYISVNEPLTNVIRILLDRQRHMALV